MKLCTSVNRSGRLGTDGLVVPPGDLPGGIKIYPNGDAIDLDYSLCLISDSPIDDDFRLLSPQAYYDESADLHVFALLCSRDSQHEGNCYVVHFVAQVLGLSDEFESKIGEMPVRKRTAFLNIMFRPGQAGPYLPVSARQLYNVRVEDLDSMPRSFVLRPSYDQLITAPGMQSIVTKWYSQPSGAWLYQVGNDEAPSERQRMTPFWIADFGIVGMSVASAIPRCDDFINLVFSVGTETKGSASVAVRCFNPIGCSAVGSPESHLYWLCMQKLEDSGNIRLYAAAMDNIMTPIVRIPDNTLLIRPEVAVVDNTSDTSSM